MSRNQLKILTCSHFSRLFPNLIRLDLRQNNISNIEATQIFCNIEYLDLGKNQLTRLTSAFLKSISRIQTLHLDYNNLEFLEPEIGDLINLKTLVLTGN